MVQPSQKISRNDPCPCGSGRRYKLCCGQLGAADGPPVAQPELPAALRSELTTLFAERRFSEMEARAQAALETYPDSGFLWQLFGLALSGQGRDAVAALERSTRLVPSDPRGHINLGNALARAGRQAEAAPEYRRALSLDSGIVDAHINLAHCLFALNDLDGAIASYRQALQLKADDGELKRHLAAAHLGAGNTLRSQGRVDLAITHYQSAVQIVPDYAAAYSNLGAALRLSGRHADATRACLKAVELEPRLVEPLVTLADVQADSGDFAAAERYLRQAVEIAPDLPEAWAGLAYVKRMSGADVAWLDKVRVLAGTGLAPPEEAVLRFALGKALDDAALYQEAAVHYQRANELSRSLAAPYDRAQVEQTVDTFARRYDAPTLRRMGAAGSPSPRPVFVIGMVRSGTTLAEQILAAHPDLRAVGELGFWNGVAAAAHPHLDHDQRLAAIVQAAGTRYLEVLGMLAPSGTRAVDKMPGNFMHVGLIRAALPAARFIHMTRDFRDNALSIYCQRFEAMHSYANDFDDIRHFYAQYQRLMAHWRAVLPADALLEVPYEALVDDQALWTRRMLEFIGVEWDPRCLNFERSVGTVLTASNWQVRQGLQRGSIGRWKHYEQWFI